MSNVLSEEKKQQVIAQGKLGWPLRRILNSLKDLVGAPGFEPGASCAQGRRATRLRYAPT
jgi:hypothetical protein